MTDEKNRPMFSILSVSIGIKDKINAANLLCMKEYRQTRGIEPMATWLIVRLYLSSKVAHQLRVLCMLKQI